MLLFSSYADNIKTQKDMVALHWITTTATTTAMVISLQVPPLSCVLLCLALGPNCPIAVAASLGVASKSPTEGSGISAGQQESSAT